MNELGWDLYSFDHEDAQRPVRVRFPLRRRAHHVRPLHLLPLHGEALRQGGRADRDLHAEALRRPHRHRRAFQHVALRSRRAARNLFACAPGDDPRGLGLTEIGYHFIGGILRHGRALCAAFAPTVNSYKRLVRRGAMSYFSWAPVFNSYGSNNRTNSVRVPMGGGRCESRNADGAVNPYLAATLALAAGLEGIREKLDPGAPNDDNLYTISERRAAAAAASSSCRKPCRRRSPPSPPIRSSRKPSGRSCATSSSATRRRNGRPTTSTSAPGRSSATATCFSMRSDETGAIGAAVFSFPLRPEGRRGMTCNRALRFERIPFRS